MSWDTSRSTSPLPREALRRAGHQVRCVDLSVEMLEQSVCDWAEAVAFSVPMHTAMRLAVQMAGELRAAYTGLPICFYGLYAAVGRDRTVGRVADRVIAGEYEPALVAWIDELDGGTAAREPVRIELGRTRFHLPARDLLPPLHPYAHLEVAGEHRLVGYVEASHGCRHRCRHCPIPTIYDGRFRIVDQEVLLADVAQLVEMGAQHITFGDADFLNGVHHSMRVVRAMHARFPDLTFDITAKVEHLLAHPDLWTELREAGLLFVVSAFETTNDEILRLLDKGHTVADEVEAIELLRRSGVEIRPSWLPFTPWTTADDLADILEFISQHHLDVDPVQLTIRLLIPEGSLVLDVAGDPSLSGFLRPRTPHLALALRGPGSRSAAGAAGRPGRGGSRTRSGQLLSLAEHRARDRRSHRSARRWHPGRLDGGKATAHRAVVLLSGTHREPVWLRSSAGRDRVAWVPAGPPRRLLGHQMGDEPATGQPRHFLERSRFFEQMGRSRNDRQLD